VGSNITNVQHLSIQEQAGYVALFRLRAALGCSTTVVYQNGAEGSRFSETDAVKIVVSQATPVALNGVLDGNILKFQARPAAEEESPHVQGQLRYRETGGPEGSHPQWVVPERYGANRGSRLVALEAKGEVLLAHAAAVQSSIGDYWLSCGHSMGISFNDSDGPLADRARELGVIACFTLGPAPRIISFWLPEHQSAE
jgi:hypothetical protein